MKHLIAGITFTAMAVFAEVQDGVGISSWCGWRPGQVSRADCPELRSVPFVISWNKLEPAAGRLEFDECIGEPLRVAAQDDLHVFLTIWVRPGTPDWLFDEKGVPRVYTDRNVDPLGREMSKEQNLHPYYLHPAYKEHFFKMIDACGNYVRSLPKELRERVMFVQSAEGSTGDGQPYKGDPLNAEYGISASDWNDFRRETWMRYQKAFDGIPILVNSDANTTEETVWMFDNMDVIALKHGMFSHGYHVSDNTGRLANFTTIQKEAAKRGIPVLTRGEMDGEMNVYGWSTKNIPQALYWSGLVATHCQLDIWNIPYRELMVEANLPAFTFFNRYAGLHEAADSSRAFCALRDGLDASDFERFPEWDFGGSPGRKNEIGRYMKIANAYSKYGARMDDPDKALGHGMINRKRMGYNDVGWGIFPGNYCRFLEQVEPGSGDVGLWNIDESIYGRFARSFEHESSKNQMNFRLDERFDAEQVDVRITYLDRGRGSWSVGASGDEIKQRVRNSDSGEWKTLALRMPRSSLRNSVLELNYVGGEDTIFHMVEVERVDAGE